MRKLILIGFIGLMPVVAYADSQSGNCPGNSCHNDSAASVGDVNATGGDADAVVFGSGNSSNHNAAFSGASSDQSQGQFQGQGINAFNGNTVEAADVKGMGSELAKHAETAGDVRSMSTPSVSPCGDSTGLSGQVGVAGGGLATVTEACRAYRLEVLTAVSPDATTTKLARITHLVGWLPRTLLHVASFGVLN